MTEENMFKILSGLKKVLPQWSPQEITRDLVNIWITVLADFSDADIQMAFRNAVATLTEWPAPATIKRLCQGTSRDDKQIGEEVATRIESAVSKYGYTNPNSARDFIGDLGWEVVLQCGGWIQVCNINSYDELPSLRKKWRDCGATVSANYYERGENVPPRLPSNVQNGHLKAALQLIHSV